MTSSLKKKLSLVHEKILSTFYGCGIVFPTEVFGARVLDLGSGSGRDCYVMSQLVGENGFVMGVDMTDEQLGLARQYEEYHREAFGYKKSNVEFKKGYIEKLDELGIPDQSFDIVISNCVVNLSPDKDAVLSQVHRILKSGGEFYFSDIYTDRRIPENLKQNTLLYGECLSGALYWNDFIRKSRKAGFNDPRIVSMNRVSINNPEIQKIIGDITFWSVTYRLFKIEELEDACEDYGQAVMYNGGCPESDDNFKLDSCHNFEKGRIATVCRNSYLMLEKTRYKKYFSFYGKDDTHFGIFKSCCNDIPFK
jgi:ubiquinone/menaquinone biosynthesis C-methylase UbiE